MINYGKVKSSIKPKAIEITKTQVFIAENITPYEEIFDDYTIKGYEYDYIGYDKDEYILNINQKNVALEAQILNTQMALCEVYESLGGGLI